MDLTVAIRLIEKGISKTQSSQIWADLGAGHGLFTSALSTCLPAGSFIYALDKDGAALRKINIESKEITLKTIQQDFTQEVIGVEQLDGILMANSLHFVKDKSSLLEQLRNNIAASGRLIMVEYDMVKSSPWVPYPVNYAALKKLATGVGFTHVTKLGEVPSVYNRAMIYSVLIY